MATCESHVMNQETIADDVAAIVRSCIFEAAYYCPIAGLPLNSDPALAIADYLVRGEGEGLCPHDLFVPEYVRGQLDELGIPLLRGSILLTYLAHPEAPINPHPLFDHTHFARLDREITHLEDYVRRVRRGETPPSPHVLFDRAFYYESNPDVAARKADAFVHYVRAGWKENRQPHPLFKVDHWTRSLAARGVERAPGNPLCVYCTDQSTWSAETHPLFDPAHLLEELTVESAAPGSRYPPLADLLLRRPELSGHRLFDPAFYRVQARSSSWNSPNIRLYTLCEVRPRATWTRTAV